MYCDVIVSVVAEKTKGQWCDTIVVMYPAIADPENFQTCLNTLQWDEERQEVIDKLGIGGSYTASKK